jgi:holliday junction DNA helicase RuvA
MIARLSGVLAEIGRDFGVVDVGGVGYLVFCSTRTLGSLPPAGNEVRLLVETHVREDHIHLYGFVDAAERDWFRRLLSVQGVGARLALAILSVLAPDRLGLAILAQDKAALAGADGVGPRLAQRVINELKDKLGGLPTSLPPAGSAPAHAEGPEEDAVSALVNLGYRRAEAFAAIAAASRRLGATAAAEALIRAGLKELAQ